MTQSLLNRLPNILATAAVRSSELLHALGRPPTPGARALLASAPADGFRFTTQVAQRLMFRIDHDLPAMLGWIAGSEQQASLRHQTGFLWLQAPPSRAATVNPLFAPVGTPASHLAADQAALSDLALRLLLARELLSPSALLAVTPSAGLEACLPFLMNTVLGRPAIRLHSANPASATGVWVCHTGATPALSPAAVRRLQSFPLERLLRDTPLQGRAAIALRAGPDLPGLLSAWPALWLLSDPQTCALSALRARLSEPSRGGRPPHRGGGVREPQAVWG